MTTAVDTTLALRSLLAKGAPLSTIEPLLDALVEQVKGQIEGRRSVFVGNVFRGAIASSTPGALAAVVACGLIPTPHPRNPLLSHSAFATVQPAQRGAFLDLLAADLDRAMADPMAPVAFAWHGWASVDPYVASILLAYGMSAQPVRDDATPPFVAIPRHPAWRERAAAVLESRAIHA